MTFTLTAEQPVWIEARVGRGEYGRSSRAHEASSTRQSSIAICSMTTSPRAKPLVDEALAEVERGEVVAFGEVQADLRGILADSLAKSGRPGVLTLEEHRRRNKVRPAKFEE